MSKNNKVFWLINQYGSTPSSGYGGRLFYLSKKLVEQGNTVFLIIDQYHHLLSKADDLPSSEVVCGVNVVRVKSLTYKGAHSPKRVFTWFIFSLKLFLLNKRINSKPDVIISSSPSPFVGVTGVLLSKFYRSTCIFDIRDIWPLTLTALGRINESHPLIWLMKKAEKISLKHSNIISSNLPNTPLRIKEVLGYDKPFIWLPNGFDESEVCMPESLNDSILSQLPKNNFIVGYVGSFGLANALEPLFAAAEKIKNKKNISIVLVGGGEFTEKFRKLIKESNLNNILIFDRVPKVQVQSILKQFDVCYVGWHDQDLYKYGIAPNKIPEYFYSGKPVLHSYSGALDPVSIASAGITVGANSPTEIANAIVKLSNMDKEQLDRMGINGNKFAKKHYNYKNIARLISEEVSND